MLNERLPPELKATPVNGTVQLFGSQAFKQSSISNTLALYLYRISIDPTIPGGYLRALPGASAGRVPEIPLMLHFLMIAIADTALAENSLMGWGFQQLAITPIIGADRLNAQALALPGQTLDWDAQTGRAVFPHPAFTKTQAAGWRWKGSGQAPRKSFVSQPS
jgi:hypothetical protein